jgi:hypothetical protein
MTRRVFESSEDFAFNQRFKVQKTTVAQVCTKSKEM